MLRALVIAAGVLVALATPGAATAATFHAAPGAANPAPPCTEAAPCPLDVAMGSAAAADDAVVLADGTYDLGTLNDSDPSQYDGSLSPAPGAHPRIVGTGGLFFYGTVLRDLTLVTEGNVPLFSSGVLERVVVDHRSTGAGVAGDAAAVELWGGGAVLRDSVVVERGDDAAAVDAGATANAGAPSVVENVTAIATGARGVGVRAMRLGSLMYCSAGYPAHVRVRNTIARGARGDLGTRVANEDGTCTENVTLDADTTNYRTIARSPNATSTILLGTGNQTAPDQTDDGAIFADAVSYRQKDGSPTIDAGRADGDTGTADPDGDLRVTGGHPDIGADEMVARPSGTATLTPLSPTSAALIGAAGAGALPLTTVKDVYVELGPTTAYGRQIRPKASLASTGAWGMTVTDLPAGALLHYRAVVTATNRLGQTRTTVGTDQTVQMPAAPAPPAPPSAPKPKPLSSLKAATVIKLGAPARSCASRRALTLRFAAPQGTRIVKAAITLRGKTTTYAGKKLKPRIDLRGLPKGKFTVKVKITLADGRTATLTKAYKTCVKAKKKAAARP